MVGLDLVVVETILDNSFGGLIRGINLKIREDLVRGISSVPPENFYIWSRPYDESLFFLVRYLCGLLNLLRVP